MEIYIVFHGQSNWPTPHHAPLLESTLIRGVGLISIAHLLHTHTKLLSPKSLRTHGLEAEAVAARTINAAAVTPDDMVLILPRLVIDITSGSARNFDTFILQHVTYTLWKPSVQSLPHRKSIPTAPITR